MNASPITSWEGVSAYFTYADNPFVIGLCFVAAVGVFAGLIGTIIHHEASAFDPHND